MFLLNISQIHAPSISALEPYKLIQAMNRDEIHREDNF